MNHAGEELHELGRRLFPIMRSITGDGLRQTLRILKEHAPDLQMHEIPTGTKCFDWVVPREWNVRSARITGPGGKVVADIADSNLHLLNYSVPIDRTMSLEELRSHLYSLPEQPDAIPYVTSYYKERWGFCLRDRDLQSLEPGQYHVHIDSELKSGSLTYGECFLPGESNAEVFVTTYICHPSMANNELSGPLVSLGLIQWLMRRKRYYSYRFVFAPETIGALAYLSRNLDSLRNSVIAGFNLTCIGDERAYSYLASRYGNTLADRVAKHVLRNQGNAVKTYDYTFRGSDERQYCAPGVDLPLVSLMRTKYLEYPEYHTSLDDFDNVVTPKGLQGGFEYARHCVEALENNRVYRTTVIGEPQLGPRGLYPEISTLESSKQVLTMLNLISYSDGDNDLLDIADRLGVPIWELVPLAKRLKEAGVLEDITESQTGGQ